MKRTLTSLLAVIIKEVRQTVRDRRVMFLVVVAPLLQLIIFGFAVNLDVDQVPTIVVDHDGSSTTRTHTRRMLADGTLIAVGRTEQEFEAIQALEAGTASVVLIFPADHERKLVRSGQAEIQVIVDGTDSNRSGVALGAVNGYFATANKAILDERHREFSLLRPEIGRIPSVELDPRVYYNPRLKTSVYMVPGVAAILLMLITTIVTAMGIAREREMGTLEQVLVTPLQSWVVILGKLLPFLAIGIIDFGFAMAAGVWIFDMPVRGELILLLTTTLLYLLTTLGMGLFVSAISKNQQQAFMGGFVFMLPATLLSGTLTPIHSMPEWMQVITYVNPMRYYVASLRAILLKGATFGDLWVNILALGMFGLIILTIASAKFRKTME
ncbi:MAG: ABC transporter permease [Myxococcota bacterium]